MSKSVASAISRMMSDAGVKRVYTVPGESFLPVLEELQSNAEIQLISTRHESGASFMADADARLSGRIAAVAATRAVGAANLSIGLHDAYQARIPVLALIGQIDSDLTGTEAFQEVDLSRLLGEVTVSSATPTFPAAVVRDVRRALASCRTGRRGPAAVALHADFLTNDVVGDLPGTRVAAASCAPDADIASLHAMLSDAARPIVIVDNFPGLTHDDVTAFAEAYGAGVYSAFRQQDSFPNLHQHYLGHLTLNTSAELLEPFSECDLVVVLGNRLDEITTQRYRLPPDRAKFVHVDDAEIVSGTSRAADLPIAADVGDVCRRATAMTAPNRGREAPEWVRQAHEIFLRQTSVDAPAGYENSLTPAPVIEAIRRRVPEDTVVVSDAGNFSVFLHRQWVFSCPHTQAAPVSGAMGYCVPGAVGAKLARPDAMVVGFAGDGGFLMTCAELETAARHGLGVKIVVFQNRRYGTIAMHQARAGYATDVCAIGPVDVAGIARSLGAAGIDCTNRDQVPDAVDEMLGVDGPAVLSVHTDPAVILPGVAAR